MANSAQDMLNGLSTDDLQKFANNDLNGMSTEGLKIIAGLPEENSVSAPIDRTKFQTPQWQGGAMSPANIQAQQQLKQAQGQVENLDPQIAAVGAAYNASWPASMMAMKAMGQGNTPVPRATTGGGALMQDAGMFANPLTGEAIGLAGKGIRMAGNAIGQTLSKVPTVLNSTKGADFANSVQQAFLGVKKAAVDKFGTQLETLAKNNPNKTVDLGNVINDIKQNWGDLSNDAKSDFKRTPVLRDLLKDTANVTADTVPVSLEDTQKIINHLNSSVPANIKAKNLDLMHTLYDIKGSQLEAFPEMAQAKQEYGAVMQPYNQVRNYFKFNRTLDAIKSGFGGDQGIEAVKKLGLPDDIIKQMGGYKNAASIIKATPWLTATGAGTAIGDWLLHRR